MAHKQVLFRSAAREKILRGATLLCDAVRVARMLGGQGDYGFDAARKEYVDMVEAGIIDPTKVVRIGLENAVSVASVLLLTEVTMTEIPETKREPSLQPEMGM